MAYKCLCGRTAHVVYDTFAGEHICRRCRVAVSSGATECNEASCVSDIQIPASPWNRHRKTVQQLEVILDKIYASDAINGCAVSMSKRIVIGQWK